MVNCVPNAMYVAVGWDLSAHGRKRLRKQSEVHHIEKRNPCPGGSVVASPRGLFCPNWDHLTTLNNQSSHAPLAFAILQDFQVPSLSIPHKHGPS